MREVREEISEKTGKLYLSEKVCPYCSACSTQVHRCRRVENTQLVHFSIPISHF